ncbi:hypothetical protein [Nibrella viscosa]|uniref:hypothetical protein n=1 Tax=Nibrella viscosa TaxID=1084524 RepID=UPI0031EC228E
MNESDVPGWSELVRTDTCQNDIEVEFKGIRSDLMEQRRFYVALEDEWLPAHLGVFRHLKRSVLQDKAYKINVFEVYM